jgi:glycosyltransferase involved in cell wall biosynthesis
VKIIQFIPNCSWGDLTPTTMNEKGLGGRETALLQLGENWAMKGHEVINFVPLKKPERSHFYSGGSVYYVDQRMAGDYIKQIGCDVLVSWEEPRIFDFEWCRANTGLRVIEMQVSNLNITKELDDSVHNYAVLSKWAGEWLVEQAGGVIDPEKLVVFPNGVDLSRYSKSLYPVTPDRDHLEFYYSSSPDRGLNHLLRMWPKIRKVYPGALLHIAYGIENWVEMVKWSHNMHGEVGLDLIEGIRQDGVVYHGRIGQDELAAIQYQCDALLYPADTMQPTETGCITVVEAGAAGCPAVITDCDCLGSEFSWCAEVTPLPFNENAYIESIGRALDRKDQLTTLGRQLAQQRDWSVIAQQWLDWFEVRLGEIDARK